MARLCVLICRIDDEKAPDRLTELKRVDRPALDVHQGAPGTALDQIETQAVTNGQEVEELLSRPNLSGLVAQLAPATPARRPAAWSSVLEAAVEAALSQEQATPPEGVTLEALAWLKALKLNHEWNAYWAEGRLPSLVAG
jgi:hypothetical protein